MSYRAEYKTFFESPAGVDFIAWISDRREAEHELGEKNSAVARDSSQAARGFGEVLSRIETEMLDNVSNPYSSGKSDQVTSQATVTTSTGLGTSL